MNRIPNLSSTIVFRLIFSVVFFLLPLILLAQSKSLSTKTDAFLKSLSEDQKGALMFPFDEINRYDWHFVPPNQFQRTGIPIKSLDTLQKDSFSAMLQQFLSEKGYVKTKKIMDLEYILRILEPDSPLRIPENYFISIYGIPGQDEIWGWKFTGHHIALNFTVVGKELTVAPFFFGANPATVMEGPQKGFRALQAEEDLGFELLNSLDETQKSKAIFKPKENSAIVITNTQFINPKEEVGIAAKEMSVTQKIILESLIATYLADMPEKIAKERKQKIKKEDFDAIRFGWAGATVLGQAHYFRIQGKSFLIEFDNSQNNANHIHTVWRDFNGGDYGLDLIKAHYQQNPHHN